MAEAVHIKMGFIKKKEDFICQVCKTEVKGTGYTNHCPKCLYSLHVDEEKPGDRLSECRGLMKPIGAEMKKGKQTIIHKCQKCRKRMKNKTSPEDDLEEILKISN